MATHESNAYKLGVREKKFVYYYIETGDLVQAVEMAGFKTTSPKAYARKLLEKGKIQKELRRQLDSLQNEAIASADEIMRFYTEAMRGQIKDQFGLEATLADRMKAADALAKRQIDMQATLAANEDREFKFVISWDRAEKAENLPTVIPPNIEEPDFSALPDDISDEE